MTPADDDDADPRKKVADRAMVGMLCRLAGKDNLVEAVAEAEVWRGVAPLSLRVRDRRSPQSVRCSRAPSGEFSAFDARAPRRRIPVDRLGRRQGKEAEGALAEDANRRAAGARGRTEGRARRQAGDRRRREACSAA